MNAGPKKISPEELELLVREHDSIMAACVIAGKEGQGVISVRAFRRVIAPRGLSNKATKKLVHDFRRKKLELLETLGMRESSRPPTPEEKDAARILKRKLGIPQKLGVAVVRGEITEEIATARIVERKRRKADRSARKAAELGKWKPKADSAVWGGVADWLKMPPRREPPPEGDFYAKGRRLPGSFGKNQ